MRISKSQDNRLWPRRDLNPSRPKFPKWVSRPSLNNPSLFAVGFRRISRLSSAFFNLPWFKLPHFGFQVTNLQKGEEVESISNFLTGNQFRVTLRILSPHPNRRLFLGIRNPSIVTIFEWVNRIYLNKNWGCTELDFLLKFCWLNQVFSRRFRISGNYHRVHRIREIGSLQVHTGYLTFSLKKAGLNISNFTNYRRSHERAERRGEGEVSDLGPSGGVADENFPHFLRKTYHALIQYTPKQTVSTLLSKGPPTAIVMRKYSQCRNNRMTLNCCQSSNLVFNCGVLLLGIVELDSTSGCLTHPPKGILVCIWMLRTEKQESSSQRNPWSPACATFLVELCNPKARQTIELESCSNPLRIQQVL